MAGHKVTPGGAVYRATKHAVRALSEGLRQEPKTGVHHGNQKKWITASSKGPAEYFTGAVRIDPLFQPKEPARTLGANVTFEPGAGPHGTPTRWAKS